MIITVRKHYYTHLPSLVERSHDAWISGILSAYPESRVFKNFGTVGNMNLKENEYLATSIVMCLVCHDTILPYR